MQEPFFAFSPQRVDTKTWNAEPNQKINLAGLAALVKSPPPGDWEKMRALYREGIEAGNTEAKTEADALKINLPYVLFSGYCPRHHNNKTLQYNRHIQIDWDYKKPGGDVRVRIIMQVVRELMENGTLYYVVACFLSPSGYGLKLLVRTDNEDPKNHVAVAKAIFADLNKKLADYLPEGGKFDSLGASQPCYVPYDPDAFFYPSVRPFHYVAPEVAPTDAAAPTAAPQQRKPAAANQQAHSGTSADADELQAAYNFLLDNRVVLADCRNGYRTVIGVCMSAFGWSAGKDAAWSLLNNCPAFLAGDCSTRLHFEKVTADRQPGVLPPEWLFKQARAHGWRPERRIEKTSPQATTQAPLQAQQGEKFADFLTRRGEPLQGKRWVVPTGSGKTYAVAASARAGNKTVLAVPVRSTARNISEQYGAVLFDGEHRDVPPDAGFFVVTYASVEVLAGRLSAVGEWHLVVDEVHNVTTSASPGFMYRDIVRLLDIAPYFASLTTLTGTDVHTSVPLLRALPKVEVDFPRTIPKTAKVVRTSGTLDAAASAVAEAVAAGKKCIVALNDKGTKLARLTARLDGVQGAAVEYFNSENKDGEAFGELCRNGMFPKGVNVIVTTSVLKEGNNINDVGAFVFVFLGRFHTVDMEQLTARARKATGVETFVIKGKKNAEKEARAGDFDPEKVRNIMQKEAKGMVLELNAAGAGLSQKHRGWLLAGALAVCRAETGRALPIAEKDGVFCVPDVLLDNYVHEKEKEAQYHSDQLQAGALGKWFNVVEGEPVAEAGPMVAPEVERAAVEAYKAQQEKEYSETLERLEVRGVTPTTIQNELEQCQTKGGTRSALEVVARVAAFGITIPDAVEAVRKYAPTPSKKKARELCDLITFSIVRDNTKKPARTGIGRFVSGLLAAFADGEKVTTAELISRVEGVTGEKYDGKRADKPLRLARLLFAVRATKQRISPEKLGDVWEICYVSFPLFYKKKKQEVNVTFSAAADILNRFEVAA